MDKTGAYPYPRRYPGYGVINNKLYLAGGFAGPYNDKANAYAPATDFWEELAPVNPSDGTRVLSATVYDGKLYVFGGSANPADVRAYDSETNQ